MKNLKENILDILKDRNISVPDFCEFAKLGKNYVYELDTKKPTLNKAVNIANYLQVSLDYLVGRTDNDKLEKPLNANLFLGNLNSILKQSNITKEKFCEDLVFSTSCFTRWKKGSFPYLRTIVEIADYLDCQIDELLI